MVAGALRTPAEHAALVSELQTEYFADDLHPPEASIAWPEEALQAFFERGGDDDTTPADEWHEAPELIIPIGGWCALATILQAMDARSASFPFDWVYTDPLLTLRFLEADCDEKVLFSGAANLRHVLPHNRTSPGTHEWEATDDDQATCDDAERAAFPVDGARHTEPLPVAAVNDGDGLQAGCHVQDMVSGAVFPHDFGAGPLEEQFARVLDKYRRRCARLRAALQSRSVLLLLIRNSYLTGEHSAYDSSILQRLETALRRWPRVRCECWNLVDAPPTPEDAGAMPRVRHHVQPLFHDPDGSRDKHVWVVLGLRIIELGAVGAGGATARAAVLQGAKALLQTWTPPAPTTVPPSQTLRHAAAPPNQQHSNRAAKSHDAVVISLERRSDRREAFFARWPGGRAGEPPPRVEYAIDGAALLRRKDVPLGPRTSTPSPTIRALLADWRGSLCAHDRTWAPQLPRKLGAVAACHLSHLLLWDQLVQTGDDQTVLVVFEDDAEVHLPPGYTLTRWFEEHMRPKLPPDWAFCYLNEPLKLLEKHGSRARSEGAAAILHDGWIPIPADHPRHEAARCVSRIDGVPASEAYVIRRAAAMRLLEFSASHGIGAVDYIIAKAFADDDALAAFPIGQPYLDYLGAPDPGASALSRGDAPPQVSMLSRVYLVDPPIAHQAMGTADSDIQNWVVFDGKEMSVAQMFQESARKELQRRAGEGPN